MAKKLSTKTKILNALGRTKGELTPLAVARRARTNHNTTRRCLQELAASGRVGSDSGYYSAISS